uniref:Uncharacterized protein n=1 Tax=Rhizophora mucronata TaxID=61149 RepID=A0A2P2QSN8_RHIMU
MVLVVLGSGKTVAFIYSKLVATINYQSPIMFNRFFYHGGIAEIFKKLEAINNDLSSHLLSTADLTEVTL